LEIFRQKTAPAFEVALKLGAAFAGRLEPYADALHRYSEALGIAYQIRDDMDDLSEDAGENFLGSLRPSVLLAKAREMASGADKQKLDDLWSREPQEGTTVRGIRELVHQVGADEKCLLMLETYKETAIRSLGDIDSANLKGLLRRVIGKMFNELEIKGWCREFEVRNGVREGEAEESPVPRQVAADVPAA
jgi:geranylgeranyl pyrophosphate synthase